MADGHVTELDVPGDQISLGDLDRVSDRRHNLSMFSDTSGPHRGRHQAVYHP